MFTYSRTMVSWRTIAVLGTLVTLPGLVVQAQPPAKAEVDPQPVERIRKPRAARKAKANAPVKQDQLVQNFEAVFGRKLTADQEAQLKKATEDREAATRAAQQAWRTQFSQITGVTETELKQKQRELRQRRPNGAALPAAKTEAPKADAPKADAPKPVAN